MSWVRETTSVQRSSAWKGENPVCNKLHCRPRCLLSSTPKGLQTVYLQDDWHVCWCRYELCTPSGDTLASFPFSECPPPSHRPDHEMRVVMREAIPRVLTQQLPPGTIHFDAGAAAVTATSTGASLIRGKQKNMCLPLVPLCMGSCPRPTCVRCMQTADLPSCQNPYMPPMQSIQPSCFYGLEPSC